MPRLLVQIVTGPENPTRAALGLLVAKAALATGHDVDVFFGGRRRQLSCGRRRSTSASGIGTG